VKAKREEVSSMSAVGARAHSALAPAGWDLEAELQPQLHDAAASRTDHGIAGCYVGRGAAAAKRTAIAVDERGVIAEAIAIRRAVRVGDNRRLENVKHLPPELGAQTLLEREGLEYREIPVLEARVAEDVPAHIAKRI